MRMDEVQLDYFRPIIERYNLSVRNGRLSLAGNVEYAPKVTRLILERVLLQGVALEYRHLPATAQAEQARVEQTAALAREAATTSTAELRIDRLEIVKSAFGNAGQKCSAASRLYIPSNLWPEVRAGLSWLRGAYQSYLDR